MKKSIRYILYFALALLVSACVFKNEMAYPREFAEILSFKVENESQPAEIDKKNMTVNVILNEQADIHEVKWLDYTFTGGATSTELPEFLDLSQPYHIELKNYHTYKWSIVGLQPVSRHINCIGIADEVQWMPNSRQAMVHLLRTIDLKNVHIEDMKLGLEGSEIIKTTGVNSEGVPETVECNFPMDLDCRFERTFTVRYKGEETEWKIVFDHIKSELSIKSVLPWCYHADVEGEYDGVGEVAMEYRKAGTQSWTAVEQVTIKGTKVVGDVTNLKAATRYEVRLSQNSDFCDPYTFTTGKPEQLENMDFEEWSKIQNDAKKDVYYPFADGKPIWATANEGVVTFAGNTTMYDETHVHSGTRAAKMITSYAVVALAAGNLFTGKFDKLVGTTAHLYWGTPYTARPSKLTGWYDYSPRKIDKAQEILGMAGGMRNPYFNMKGKMDNMQIMVALVAAEENEWKDKGAYKVISTKPGTPQLNPALPDPDPRVIAYGELVDDEDTHGEYRKFELDIKYYDDRTPAYVIVVACSSAYGNFFTGGVGSQLYVDDFKFEFE